MARQDSLCSSLQLTGRIRISTQGINGVLSGLYQNLLIYQSQTSLQLNLQPHLDVKYSHLRRDLPAHVQLFEALSIKTTREVISLFDATKNPQESNHDDAQNVLSSSSSSFHNHDDSFQQPQPTKSSLSTGSSRVECQTTVILTQQRQFSYCSMPAMSMKVVSDTLCVEGIPTLLANTRKYSNLPHVLTKIQRGIPRQGYLHVLYRRCPMRTSQCSSPNVGG